MGNDEDRVPREEWAFPRPSKPWDAEFADDDAFLFRKIGARSHKLYSEAREPLGLRPNQVAVLQYLNSHQGASQRELVDGLWIDASSMVALMREFEKRGFVRRTRNPRDRRASAVYLTDEGRRTLRQALALSRDVQR